MNEKQAEQMVAWLDEERRKDKALIVKLEERVAAQATMIEDQVRRIQSLETELMGMSQRVSAMSRYEEALGRARDEVQGMIAQSDERRLAAEQEMRKLRDLDRDGVAKALDEVRGEMVKSLERELSPRKAEEERLARVASDLEQYAQNLSRETEDFERSLAFLEEQRRQDSKRISDLHGDLLDVRKRLDADKTKLELLEELSRRNERLLGELRAAMDEVRQAQQERAEQEAMVDQQRERQMAEMTRRMDAFAEEMQAHAKRVEGWAETNQAMRKHVSDFERLADRVERRLNEVAEMQRLSEERFRGEWEAHAESDQKRWRQFTLTNDEAWREHNKRSEERDKRLIALEEALGQRGQQLEGLLALQTDYVRELTTLFQTLSDQISVMSKPPG
jgi:chromosome segregation ATPase